MYYVLIRTKKGKWRKTMYGARRCGSPPYGFGDMTSKNFQGIPFKFEADQALQAARQYHPKETYRLVYSEEEL